MGKAITDSNNQQITTLFWRFHPDYTKEIMERYNQAQEEGREYIIDKAEAAYLIKKVGPRMVSQQIKDEFEMFKSLGMMTPEEKQEILRKLDN